MISRRLGKARPVFVGMSLYFDYNDSTLSRPEAGRRRQVKATARTVKVMQQGRFGSAGGVTQKVPFIRVDRICEYTRVRWRIGQRARMYVGGGPTHVRTHARTHTVHKKHALSVPLVRLGEIIKFLSLKPPRDRS